MWEPAFAVAFFFVLYNYGINNIIADEKSSGLVSGVHVKLSIIIVSGKNQVILPVPLGTGSYYL